MDRITPVLRAFACRSADSACGDSIDYFCPWCEIIHSHGVDDVAIGDIENDASKCWEGGGSPHFGRGVNLKIARLVDDFELIDPRSQWRRDHQPLYRALYLLRERLMPIMIGKLLKVEIDDLPIIYQFDFDQIDLSIDLSGRWHALHHHTAVAPSDVRHIESRGCDLLSLVSAFGDLDIAEVAYAIVGFFAPDLAVDTRDFWRVFEAWEKWRCIRRPDLGGESNGRLDLKTSLRKNGPNLPAFEEKVWSDVLTDILTDVLAFLVPVIARATLPDDFADITDGRDLCDALRLVYGLSEGMVLLRLLENITAASLDEGCALAFVAVIDGGDLSADGAGTPPVISPAAAVTRVLTAPEMAKPVNDDLPERHSAQALPAADSLVAAIGGDA